jgi:hypothetical protein
VLKLPGLAGALVVAGDSSPGVGGARIVSFPSFFFVASVSQWVFLVGGKEPLCFVDRAGAALVVIVRSLPFLLAF